MMMSPKKSLRSLLKKSLILTMIASLVVDTRLLVAAQEVPRVLAQTQAKQAFEQAKQTALNASQPEKTPVSSTEKPIASPTDEILKLPDTIVEDDPTAKSLQARYGDPIAVSGFSAIYRKSNGSFVTHLTPQLQTYQDKKTNQEKVVDTTLLRHHVNGQSEYKANQSPVEVTLPTTVNKETPVSITYNHYTLRIAPKDKTYSQPTVKANAIRYNQADNAIDVQYSAQADGVKEDIILDKYTGIHTFTYVFSAKNFDAKLENNRVLVWPKGSQDLPLYVLSAPVMIDAKQQTSTDIKVSLKQVADVYEMTIDASEKWLTDSNRVYPVKIDPTINVTPEQLIHVTTSTIQGTYLGAGYGYAGYITSAMIKVPWARDIGRSRMYFKINHDFRQAIPDEAVIDRATLNLYQYTHYPTTTATYGSFYLKEDWQPNTLNWNNSVGLANEVSGEQAVSNAKKGFHHFDIKTAVNAWVKGLSQNYGLMIRALEEDAHGAAFYTPLSAGTAGQDDYTPDKKPSLTIEWHIPNGVDFNYPNTTSTIVLRPMTIGDKKGQLHVKGVSSDGLAAPLSTIRYQASDTSLGYADVSLASYSKRYPNTSHVDNQFPQGTTRYKDNLSNWQVQLPLTNFKTNTNYTIQAEVSHPSQAAHTLTSEPFIVYEVTQFDTLPAIADHYGVPLQQLMADNRVQDLLLVAKNTLFIRNPKQNIDNPYNPPVLTDDRKRQIDGQLMGRGLHCEFGFEPINLNTGNFYYNRTDVSIPEVSGNFAIMRHYNSQDANRNSRFGRGFRFAFDETLTQDDKGNLLYTREDGSTLIFTKTVNGYKAPEGYDLTLTTRVAQTKTFDFGGGDEAYDVLTYHITDSDNQEKVFNHFGLLHSQTNKKGETTRLGYDNTGKLTRIESPNGLVYQLTLDNAGRIIQINLPNGSVLRYEYDTKGYLTTMYDTTGTATRYTYNDKGLMVSWFDGNGHKMIENTYDENGRVLKQIDANGYTATLHYEDGKTVTTDNNGNRTTYHVDALKRTTRIDYADGTSVRKTYTSDNRLASVTNEVNQQTTYAYDTSGRLSQQTRFDGAVATYQYDARGNLTRYQAFDGTVQEMTYDGKGQLTSLTQNGLRQATLTYDAKGRLSQHKDVLGHATTFHYDNSLWVTRVVDALSGTQQYTYTPHGKVQTHTNAMGGQTHFTYDTEGRKLSETRPDGSSDTLTFDASGQVTAITNAKGEQTHFHYDAMGNRVGMTNATGGRYTFAFDGNQNLVQASNPLGHTTTYTYDARNRLTTEINPLGHHISYVRDAKGRVITQTNPNGQVTTYTYDVVTNHVSSVTDALKQKTHYTYTSTGKLAQINYANGEKISYTYDDANRVHTVTDRSGVMTTYTYDDKGNVLTQETNGLVTSYEYDALSRLIRMTLPDGKTTTYQYDANGNRTSVKLPDGSVRYTTYTAGNQIQTQTDALGHVTTYGYDASGKLNRVVDALGGVTELSYNPHGTISKRKDANGHETTYVVDQMARVSEQVDALGHKTLYRYNAIGLPEKITNAKGQVSQLTYTPTGQVKTIVSPNGETVTYHYDALDRVIQTDYPNGRQVYQTYDVFNRVMKVWDNQTHSVTYAYNARHQVTAQTNALGETTTYTYDDNGNITRISYPDKTIETFVYDKGQRLVSHTKVDGTVETMTYDEMNRVLSVTHDNRTVAYRYDANGNRLETIDSLGFTTKMTYNALNQLVETTNANGKTRKYAYDKVGNLTIGTDEIGVETIMVYDALNRPQVIRSADGMSVSYQYDPLGNVTSQTSGEGNVTAFDYDNRQRLTTKTDPMGNQTIYTYDVNGLREVTDALGHKTTYVHNVYGQLTDKQLPNGATFTYAYDPLQRLTHLKGPQGQSRAYTYDISGHLIREEDQSKRQVAYTYDKAGNVTQVTNPLGQQTAYQYDNRGNIVKVVTPAGKTTQLTYDERDQVIKVVGPSGKTTDMTYDGMGNRVSQTINKERTTTYTYTARNQLDSVTNALGEVSRYTYDANGRLATQTNASGETVAYQYDKDSRVTRVRDQENREVSYTYDKNGNVTHVSAGNQLTSRYTYDALNRVTQAITGSDKPITATYTYDSVGNVTSITDGNNHKTTYTYDQLNNVTSYTTPLGDVTTMGYDVNNRLKTMTQPNGTVLTYDYDKLDRLVSKTPQDKPEQHVLYGYDKDGQRISMIDVTGESKYTYNIDGQLTAVTNGDNQTVKYEYDQFGNLSKLIYPDETFVQYTYDALDRLVKVLDRAGKETIYTYDKAGNVVETTRGNRSKAKMTYNRSNQLTKLVNVDSSGAVVSEYAYTYNSAGMIERETITVNGVTMHQQFTYDGSGQLMKTHATQSDGKALFTESYTYDGAGNRIKLVREATDGVTETTFTYDNNNRLIERKVGDKVTTYSYDANGNRVKQVSDGDELTYGYDVYNRLMAVRDKQGLLMAALYDGDDNRVFLASRTTQTFGYQLFVIPEDKKRKSPYTSVGGFSLSTFWHAITQLFVQSVSVSSSAIAKEWTDTFEDLSIAYHKQQAKEKAQRNGLVVENGDTTVNPSEEHVTYASDVNETLIPYTTVEDSMHVYDVKHYVNDVNRKHTQVLSEYDGHKRQQYSYDYGHQRLNQHNHREGKTRTYTTDGRGSVESLSDSDDDSEADRRYSTFGLATKHNAIKQPFGYNSEAHDVTGLQYLRARYYDPSASTFITQDTYSGTLTTPLTQNRYTYVGNNPINYIDPSGHYREPQMVIMDDGFGGRPAPPIQVNPRSSVVYKPEYREDSNNLLGLNQLPWMPKRQPLNPTRVVVPDPDDLLPTLKPKRQLARLEQQLTGPTKFRAELQAQIGKEATDKLIEQVKQSKLSEFSDLDKNLTMSMVETHKHFCETGDKAYSDYHKQFLLEQAKTGNPIDIHNFYDEYGNPITQEQARKVGRVFFPMLVGGVTYLLVFLVTKSPTTSNTLSSATASATGSMMDGNSPEKVAFDTAVGVFSGYVGAKVTIGANQFTSAMNPVNAYLVKTGIETTTDTAIDLVTGRPVTPETVFQNLAMNLIGNGVPLLPLGNSKPVVSGPYKDVRKQVEGTGVQAHHTNQTAAFGFDKNSSYTVAVEGNIFKDVGSPHYKAHQYLEDNFWDMYRKGGKFEYRSPTVNQYNNALKHSLQEAGFNPAQVNAIMKETIKEQLLHGLTGNDIVPRVPNRINFKR